jgi:hypothetical protein
MMVVSIAFQKVAGLDETYIEPSDSFNRFFGGRRNSNSRSQGSSGFPDFFRAFDEMRREMEDMFKDIKRAPKDLIREYENK